MSVISQMTDDATEVMYDYYPVLDYRYLAQQFVVPAEEALEVRSVSLKMHKTWAGVNNGIILVKLTGVGGDEETGYTYYDETLLYSYVSNVGISDDAAGAWLKIPINVLISPLVLPSGYYQIEVSGDSFAAGNVVYWHKSTADTYAGGDMLAAEDPYEYGMWDVAGGDACFIISDGSPAPLINPSPADGAVGIPLGTEALSWEVVA